MTQASWLLWLLALIVSTQAFGVLEEGTDPCRINAGDGSVFDLRALAGTYEASDAAGNTYVYSPCKPLASCSGTGAALVCQQHRVSGMGKVSMFTETALAQQPVMTAWQTDDRTLSILYAPAQDTMLLGQLDSMAAFAAARSGMLPPAMSHELESEMTRLREQAGALFFTTLTRFVCPVNASRADPVRFTALGLLNASMLPFMPPGTVVPGHIYGLEMEHACLCANASCPPRAQRATHECVQAWESYLWKNIPALVLVVVFCFLEKRRKWYPDMLWGRPGLPTPVNFLDDRSHRFITACMFGGFSSIALSYILGLVEVGHSDIWGTSSLLYNMWMMVLMGGLFYPIGLCSNCSNRLIGALLGILYCGMATYVYSQTFMCLYKASRAFLQHYASPNPYFCFVQHQPFPLYMTSLPTFVSLFGSTIYFTLLALRTLWKVVKALRQLQRSPFATRSLNATCQQLWYTCRQASQRPKMNFHFYRSRVRQLLKNERRTYKTAAPAGRLYRCYCWLSAAVRSRLYQRMTYFRYSPRILAMATVAIFLLFEVVIVWCLSCKRFAQFVYHILDSLHCHPAGVMMSLGELPTTSSFSETLRPYLEMVPGIRLSVDMDLGLSCSTIAIIRDVVYYCFLASGIISCLLHIAFLAHMLACSRKHILRLCKGDRSMIPAMHTRYPAFAIVDGLKYAGFQVAYLLVGWLLVALVWCLICLFIAFTIVLPIMGIYKDFFWHDMFLPRMWPFVISVGLYYFQALLVRLLFQTNSNSFNIRNRRLFNNIDFFFFFVNLFVGLYSFVVRLGANIFYGLLFLCRLDKNMLSRGYEMQDPGFRTYIGFLLLDYYYSNPVSVSFAEILMEDLAERRAMEHTLFPLAFQEPPANWSSVDEEATILLVQNGDSGCVDDDASALARFRAQRCHHNRRRNKWCLLVTLVNNPRLRDDRKASDRRRRGSFRTCASEVWQLEHRYSRCRTCGHGPTAAPSRTSSAASFDYWPSLASGPCIQVNGVNPAKQAVLRLGSPIDLIARGERSLPKRGHRRRASMEPNLLNLNEESCLEASIFSEGVTPSARTESQEVFAKANETPPLSPGGLQMWQPLKSSRAHHQSLNRVQGSGHIRLPSFDADPPTFVPGHLRLPSLDLKDTNV